MTKIERVISRYTVTPETCSHDGGFFCTTISNMQQNDSFYAFACGHRCGYYINFDPFAAGKIENKKFPENANKDWRAIGNVYYDLEQPGRRSDGQEWKTMAPFSKERLKLTRD